MHAVAEMCIVIENWLVQYFGLLLIVYAWKTCTHLRNNCYRHLRVRAWERF